MVMQRYGPNDLLARMDDRNGANRMEMLRDEFGQMLNCHTMVQTGLRKDA
jgi:hypothetical protein